MTPKEKAKELFDKMLNSLEFLSNKSAKQCALIAADECMTEREDTVSMQYWMDVKEEIENL